MNELLRNAIAQRVGQMGGRSGVMGGSPQMGIGPQVNMPGGTGLSMRPPSQPFDLNSMGDPRGLMGILSRGSNVYQGGMPSAPGAGRPKGRNGPGIPMDAIGRRLGR